MAAKILFLSHSAELNGAERMLLGLLTRLDRSRYTPRLVLPRSGPFSDRAEALDVETSIIPMKWWLSDRSKIWRQPLAWLWNLKGLRILVDAAREWGTDLIFTNSSANFTGALAASRLDIPHMWSIHENLSGPEAQIRYLLGEKRLIRRIMRLSCCVAVNSRLSGEAFSGDPKVSVVYNGISLPDESLPDPDVIRRDLGVETRDLVLGVVGKIYRGKGQEEVLKSLRGIQQSSPRARLLLVGEIADSRYLRKLMRIVSENRLEKSVFFSGYREDIFSCLKAMDILIIASKVESFGRTAVEAMAAGVPVVALETGGLREIISHGENGCFFSSTEPGAIEKAVAAVIQNPDLRKRIVQGGYRTVHARFLLDSHVRKMEELMERCLGRGRPNA